jgi:predicted PurR-regulated permease PerM
MTPSPRSDRRLTLLLAAAGVVVVVAGLKAASELLRPFVLAVFLAITSFPLVAALERRRVPRLLAVAATVLADVAVLVGILLLVGTQVNAFTQELPGYQQQLSDATDSVQRWLVGHGLDLEPVPLREMINVSQVMDLLGSTLRGLAGVVSKVVLVLLIMIFILVEASGFRDKLSLAFGVDIDTERLASALQDIQRYLGFKTVISLATGTIIWAWVSVAGVDFAVLWGLLAFLLNYIPNLGSIIASVPPVLLAALQQGPGTAAFVALGFLLVNLALGNILEPSLMGRRFGLSTLVVFLSLIFWGWVWGPVGMLLSVPLTMTIKILLENSAGMRWLATLMGKNPRPQSSS